MNILNLGLPFPVKITNQSNQKHHFYDAQFKKIIKQKFPDMRSNRIGTFLADFMIKKDNTYYRTEYENSSRGMITHVSKYIYLAQTYPQIFFKVLIIRSLTHQLKHNQDNYLANAVARLSLSLLHNLSITILDCDGTEEKLISGVASFLSFQREQAFDFIDSFPSLSCVMGELGIPDGLLDSAGNEEIQDCYRAFKARWLTSIKEKGKP